MQPKRIGDASIESVIEFQGPVRSAIEMYPDATPDMVAKHRGWLAPTCMEAETDILIITHQSYILRHAGLTILIDTCIGEDKERPGMPMFHKKKMPLLNNLKTAGVQPEEIDLVLCTHMHADHVGWNTRLANGKWVPTFPNARYIFNKIDFEYWEQADGPPWMQGAFEDSVLPIVEAGQADLVDGDHQIRDGLWLEPLPGHSPGMVGLHVESGGDHAVFCGDLMHHPIQVPEGQMSSIFCDDPVQSAATRQAFLARHADTKTLVLPTHFADDSAGRIVSTNDGLRFKFGG